MKKLGTILLCIFACSVAFGQSNGPITASASTCTTLANTAGACIILPLAGNSGSAVVSLGASAFSGTLQFEESSDGQASWKSILGTLVGATTTGTSTTSLSQDWQFNVSGGMTHIRVRCSAYSSGTAAVSISQSVASARAAGAATGSVTSIATTAPITGGTITSTGTIACATCTTSTAPGAGVAHFAGSTQDLTSSAVALGDVATQSNATFLSNVSGGTAAPSANALPATANALIKTNNTNGAMAASTVTDNGTTLATTDALMTVGALPVGQGLCFSSTQTGIVQNGSTQNVYSCTIPAGLFATGHAFRVKFSWSETGGISTAYALKIGGTVLLTSAGTTATVVSSWDVMCIVTGSNAQTCNFDNIIQGGATAAFLASTSGAAVTATETTGSASTIVLTSNAASGTVTPRIEFGVAY